MTPSARCVFRTGARTECKSDCGHGEKQRSDEGSRRADRARGSFRRGFHLHVVDGEVALVDRRDLRYQRRRAAIRAETPLASTVCHLVSQGLGASLVIRESAVEFAHLGYHIVPFRPRVEYRAYLISSTTRALPTVAQGFRDMLLTAYRQSGKRVSRAIDGV